MKIPFETYKDKVKGCWLGKNIGGVLGAPFEGQRGVKKVTFNGKMEGQLIHNFLARSPFYGKAWRQK